MRSPNSTLQLRDTRDESLTAKVFPYRFQSIFHCSTLTDPHFSPLCRWDNMQLLVRKGSDATESTEESTEGSFRQVVLRKWILYVKQEGKLTSY